MLLIKESELSLKEKKHNTTLAILLSNCPQVLNKTANSMTVNIREFMIVMYQHNGIICFLK